MGGGWGGVSGDSCSTWRGPTQTQGEKCAANNSEGKHGDVQWE